MDPIRPGEKPYYALVQALFSLTEDTNLTDLVQAKAIIDLLKTWQNEHPHQQIYN